MEEKWRPWFRAPENGRICVMDIEEVVTAYKVTLAGLQNSRVES